MTSDDETIGAPPPTTKGVRGLVGSTLAGYRILGELGRGGMAVVYKAEQPNLDRHVAIKLVLSSGPAGEELLERFRQEAKLVAALRHPNIVTVYDFGEWDGMPYLVMEYVGRETLASREGPLPAPLALNLVAQVSRALDHAHGQGIVHRDVKPSNVLLARDDWALLSDFGIAKALESPLGVTQTGTVVGTPEFMSPEQCQAGDVDARSDLYSLGVVLYKMLTGRPPFLGATPISVIVKHISEPPPPARTFNPDTPVLLEEVLAKALSKDPSERYSTAGEMADHLEHIRNALVERRIAVDRPVRATNNLPVSTTSFIGREAVLETLTELFTSARLVTITGPGGVGKTRAAIEMASRSLETFPDGVWLAELGPIGVPDLVVTTVAEVLRVDEGRGLSLREAIIDRLRGKNALLMMDNCEHLILACAELAEDLLTKDASVRILATSREPLGVAGELLFDLPPMGLPEGDDVGAGELTGTEAVRLFTERARLVVPGLMLKDTGGRAAVSICRKLDGLPLAIELAAARLRSMSIQQIDERLGDRFEVLTRGPRVAAPRQQTLQALIDWSHDLLDAQEKILFRRLSVFGGSFTIEAAQVACPDHRLQSSEVMNILFKLVDKSLLTTSAPGEKLRYRMLETIRAYARQKLADASETETQSRRLFDWADRVVEGADLEGPDQQVATEMLSADHDNLRAAIDWAASANDHLSALRLARGLGLFWRRSGNWSEGRYRIETALANAPDADPRLRADALNRLGLLVGDQDESDLASSIYEESLAIWQEVGDPHEMSKVNSNIGTIDLHRGNYEAARERFEASLGLDRESGDRIGEAANFHNLGLLAYRQGDLETARSRLEQGVEICRQEGHPGGVALSLSLLSVVMGALGDADLRRRYCEESLELGRGLGDKDRVCGQLLNLGNIEFDEGNEERALSLYEESLDLARELESPGRQARALGNIGETQRDAGKDSLALAAFQEQLSLHRHLGDIRGLTAALLDLAGVLRGQNELQTAAGLLEEAVVHARKVGTEELAEALFLLGEVDQLQGDMIGARTNHLEALRLRLGEEGIENSSKSLIALASLDVEERESRRAARLLGAAGVVPESVDSRHRLVLERLEGHLGREELEREIAEGSRLSRAQAAELAGSP